ncbi:hypothetical protein PtrSN002B_006571 [Pyrenophora tritici-repentis]|uniref:Uncharacterized protein n=1 Tax=Pyrenophora tritici-repentis TaxID=45151 RepID=A0A2W1F1M6_9PLEO|nr:hypothetical protein PtrV1_08693 [Pyrenophora tritici-repentis]KAF7449734.1 hypothetical protein A1F99_067830 [Pyrenophora tritici-repentis]KAF7570140.1 hypothetical protein PtrM4_101420 [Pyrenophora tritici-repentis]KAG9383333.1 hypothetical protein A1F94_005244 [Pyrenophora tritici-repentis]KAI0588920.1 hypothetical protein Alg215_00584 [Pyrenophora tritici-repentis]
MASSKSDVLQHHIASAIHALDVDELGARRIEAGSYNIAFLIKYAVGPDVPISHVSVTYRDIFCTDQDCFIRTAMVSVLDGPGHLRVVISEEATGKREAFGYLFLKAEKAINDIMVKL